MEYGAFNSLLGAISRIRDSANLILTDMGEEDIFPAALEQLEGANTRGIRIRILSYRIIPEVYREGLAKIGGQVRLTPQMAISNNPNPKMNCYLIDNHVWVENFQTLPGFQGQHQLTRLVEPDEIRGVQNYFEQYWEMAIEVLREEKVFVHNVEEEQRIISLDASVWTKIIASLRDNPDELFSLTPRKFEELVAELLDREGMNVQLTQSTRDGGRDILALANNAAGRFLYYVECKRFAKTRPVGVNLVRSLYGVVEQDRVSAGLLVTTSFFTEPAKKFQESVGHRMSFKDYTNLIDWLRRMPAN